MAIRLRRDANGDWVALCAAETDSLEDDTYLDDGQHYALTLKYLRDWKKSGLLTDYDNDAFIIDRALATAGKFYSTEEVLADYEATAGIKISLEDLIQGAAA